MSPFELTLEQFKINLNNRLKPNTKKISVQGYNKPGNTQIVFTIFTMDNKYTLEFCEIKNLRFFKPEGDPQQEKENVEKYFKMFAHILNMYIT
jgi:hypothetical protein